MLSFGKKLGLQGLTLGTAAIVLGTMLDGSASAQAPTAAVALQFNPVHKADVDYDIPAAADVAKCTLEPRADKSGWIVRGPNGQVLREFVDSNNDRVVDRWCYYKDGVEVYRDIDEDFDRKAEQHRWLNTGGTRWALDKNQDGKIDSWKSISPEEVTAELVAAIKTNNVDRFNLLLLTSAELTNLGLNDKKTDEIKEKLATAAKDFNELVKSQKNITEKSQWADFGGTKPGVVPAGTDGNKTDITAYENVVVAVSTAEKVTQLHVGTLVKVENVWRLLDAPAAEGQQLAAATFFAPTRGVAQSESTGGAAPNEALQKLIDAAQKIDGALVQATSPGELTRLNDQRYEIMLQIAEASTEKERGLWYRQLADAVSSSVQARTYPEGIKRLESLLTKLEGANVEKDTLAFVKFRYLQAEYAAAMQVEKPNFNEIQTAWLEKLEKFSKEYPTSADTAEALLQLGSAHEFLGQEAKAKEWYAQAVKNFSDTLTGKKAAGAITRLDSIGAQMTLAAKDLNTGANVSIAQYKNRLVLIHYWSTWCEPAKVDMATLKELQTKYNRQGLELIGVNLDDKAEPAKEYLAGNKLPWAQLHEDGGLDSRLAVEFGVQNLPTMILVDDTGKVINRGIHITEVESEVRKKLKLDQAKSLGGGK